VSSVKREREENPDPTDLLERLGLRATEDPLEI
jgi:hypothetical protein